MTGWSSYDACKRVMDVLAAITLLVLLSPLLLTVAVLVHLDSPGPVLFRQERVGRDGRLFTMLKFRSMVKGDDREHRALVQSQLAGEVDDGDVQKLVNDPRITRLGSILRRTSIDELPQLWNVVRGDMSLVGPRPALPWEAELFSDHHRRRFEVLPGITGLWQVRGRSRLTMLEALDLDVEYVDRRSLALDLRILLATPMTVVRTQLAA